MCNGILNTDNIIQIVGVCITVIIATVGAVYTIVSNTKKYELTQSYRREIMQWYYDVISVMTEIIWHSGEVDSDVESKSKLFPRLSALIEVGRFYFPNSDDQEYGEQKTSAYQGHRDIGLTLLVRFYEIAQKPKDEDIDKLQSLKKRFTSYIFDVIQPRDRNMEFGKYLSINPPKSTTKQDYLKNNPECESLLRTDESKTDIK